MDRFDHRARVRDVALGARVREDRADQVFADNALREICNLDLEVDGAGALCRHLDHLRVQARIQEHPAALLRHAGHQPHGLCGGGRFVEKRGVRDV